LILNYVYAGVSFYFDLQVAPVTPVPVDLVQGVKIILGPSHNVLAVEAPLYSEFTLAARVLDA
jgi:hypothetical protein